MLTIKREHLPASEAELRAALEKFKGEAAAHRLTVDVPAPLPDFDVLHEIIMTGGDFVVVEGALPDAPPGKSQAEGAVDLIIQDPAALAKLKAALAVLK